MRDDSFCTSVINFFAEHLVTALTGFADDAVLRLHRRNIIAGQHLDQPGGFAREICLRLAELRRLAPDLRLCVSLDVRLWAASGRKPEVLLLSEIIDLPRILAHVGHCWRRLFQLVPDGLER